MAVDDAGGASVAVRVSFANFRTLASELASSCASTSIATRAPAIRATSHARYSSDGTLASFRWDGAQLVPLPAVGTSAAFSDGVLSFARRNRTHFGGATSFGLLVIAARTQQAGVGLLASTDFALRRRQKRLLVARPASFPDPDNDQDVAADITSISVVDTPSGSLQFRLTTANYTTLPPDKLIGLGIGLRGRPIEDDALFLGYLSGSRAVEVDREQQGLLPARAGPARRDGVACERRADVRRAAPAARRCVRDRLRRRRRRPRRAWRRARRSSRARSRRSTPRRTTSRASIRTTSPTRPARAPGQRGRGLAHAPTRAGR